MREVVELLEEIGLGHYAEAFRAHAIDRDALLELTENDLRQLGLPLGHRKKLLRAIALLGGADGRARSAARQPARPAHDAERRHLTVLFCDLVGSTELATRLDPEDLGRVVGAYHEACAGVVRRFDGYVAKYLGDGLLAFFGYPRAHGDDAERAIRASLELVDTVRKLEPGPGILLQARIGISTGEVLVGDLLGPGTGHEAVGQTPNRAARLQALAPPDAVVIGPRTRDLVGGLFDYADLGGHPIKGFEELIPIFRVLGASSAARRFDALRSATLVPLVGRDEEVALLLERWHQARAGEGHAVLLSGEAGIGKSRIVRALQERIEDRSHRVFTYQCLPYYRNSALQPVIDELERAAGIARNDVAQARIDKLSAHLATLGTAGPPLLRPLAELLSIPSGERQPALEVSPERRKIRTLDALTRRLESFARRFPLLIVFEDVQWSDPTSSELMERIGDAATRLPVLLVVTRRSEDEPLRLAGTRFTALSVSRLTRRQCVALMQRIAGDKPLPEEVVASIVDKTDGVPLFVEELTRTVLESGLLRDAGTRYELAGPLPPLAIPATLQEALMARLDRLAPAKEVAQIAAVLGRRFSHELLSAVAPLSEDQLLDAVDHLVDTGVLLRRRTAPDVLYGFRHALVQEAAYGTLVRSRREELHRRIARTLAADFPEVMESHPELIAHHCTEAGLDEEAVEFWREAGDKAMERSAAVEAAAHFESALRVLARCPATRHRDRAELGLRLGLGQVLIAVKSFAAPETGQAFERARLLAEQLGDDARRLPALFGRWLYHVARAEIREALGAAEEMVQLAEAQPDPARQLVAHRAMANTCFFVGDLAAARRHAEQALACYDPAAHRGLARQYAADPYGLSGFFLAHSLLRLGWPERARPHAARALASARELGHVVTLAHALHHACLFHELARDPLAVQQHADELVAFAAAHGLPFWHALGQIFLGWAGVELGRTADGLELLQRGTAAYRETSGRLYLPYALTLLAEACRRAGQLEEGLRAIADAGAMMRKTGVRGFEADMQRVEGELRLAAPRPDIDAAAACFERSMATAREQEARLPKLRAAVALCRVWREQGRHADAYGLLVPLYGWFTEGFATPDLMSAKALLDELAG